MSSRAILLSWKNVMMGIVYCVEVVWSLFDWDINRRDCTVVIVDPIDVLARLWWIVVARSFEGCEE